MTNEAYLIRALRLYSCWQKPPIAVLMFMNTDSLSDSLSMSLAWEWTNQATLPSPFAFWFEY